VRRLSKATRRQRSGSDTHACPRSPASPRKVCQRYLRICGSDFSAGPAKLDVYIAPATRDVRRGKLGAIQNPETAANEALPEEAKITSECQIHEQPLTTANS
jgi:hypothetical protein